MWGQVDNHGGVSSTHIPNVKMHENWSCIQKKPGWNFKNKNIGSVQASFHVYWWNASPIWGKRALIANVQIMTMFSLYIYKMSVKAKILVRGVRQMNRNEIPDIWQMAVRRFSRVQSMPSCLYKLYWAHWTEGVNVTPLTGWIEAAFNHKVGRYSAFK